MRVRVLVTAIVPVLFAVAARAAPLDDLRATLAKLPGDTAFSGTLGIASQVTSSGDDKPTRTHARITVHLASTAAGLELRFTPALLERASNESVRHARDPEAKTPTVDLMSQLDPLKVQRQVNVAPVLLRELQGATLTAQRDETRAGKPVRMLEFKLPAGLSKSDQDTITHYQGKLKLWLDANGIPVATQESRQYKGRKFLISFSFGMTSASTLRVKGDRLVALKRHREDTGEGLGQSSDKVIDTTLTPILTPAGNGES